MLYCICDTLQWNIYNQTHSDETKQMAQYRSEGRTQGIEEGAVI